MSLRKCATIKCPHYVREGLRRFGRGATGIALADGRFCWRCRARNDREKQPKAKGLPTLAVTSRQARDIAVIVGR